MSMKVSRTTPLTSVLSPKGRGSKPRRQSKSLAGERPVQSVRREFPSARGGEGRGRGIRHSKRLRIPVLVQDHDLAGHFSTMIGAARKRWPVRFGVPFPKGALRDASSLAMIDDKRRISFQAEITNRWPDASVKWASVLALVDLRVSETKTLFLQAASSRGWKEWPLAYARCYENEQGFIVSNGEMTIKASRNLDALQIMRGDFVIASTPPSLELMIEDGEVHRPRWKSATIETEGALNVRLVYRGQYASAGGTTSFDVEFGFELTAAQPWIEWFHRLNHRVAGKPRLAVPRLAVEQRWELSAPHTVVRQTHRGEEWLPRDVRQQGKLEVRVAG